MSLETIQVDPVLSESVKNDEKHPAVKLYWIEGESTGEDCKNGYQSTVLRYSIAEAIGVTRLEDIQVADLSHPLDGEFLINLNLGINIKDPHLNLVVFEYDGDSGSMAKFCELYKMSANPFNQFIILDYADQLRTGKYHNAFTEFLAKNGLLHNAFNIHDLQNVKDLILGLKSRLIEKENLLKLYYKSLNLEEELIYRNTLNLPSRKDLYCFDGYEIDLIEGVYCLRNNGEYVEITPTELRVLLYFLQNPNRVVTPQELSVRVWSDCTPEEDDTGRVAVFIFRIRKIINNERFNRLRTVRGFGYQFCA